MARRSEKTTKGEPFSVRFSLAVDRAMEDEARRFRRSKSAVVESLANEALRTRLFPGIAFRGEDVGRRPWVIGSGLDVWEICQMVDEFESIEELVTNTELTERQVRLALAYRERYPDEIEEAIEENRRPPGEWEELYPFVRTPSSATR
jgi:uncharacterized protein (DUF433 family)